MYRPTLGNTGVTGREIDRKIYRQTLGNAEVTGGEIDRKIDTVDIPLGTHK
jgi:hypothetical protein